VTVGLWVGVGSRDESPTLAGASHYLEHLLFKGTARRSALDISIAIDAVGGEMNAFTTKEYTCYHARVLDDDLPVAVDVLTDAVTSSLIAPADVDAERGVVLEEIAMRDDDPTDAVHDEFAQAVLGDSPLGRPVLGTVDSIRSMTRAGVAGYYRRRYQPETLVVTAAGNVDHARLVRLVRSALRGTRFDQREARPAPPRQPAGRGRRVTPGQRVLRKETEQASLVLGGLGLSRSDERRFALSVFSAALGGGMSSRLFQEIREKRGLAYSVYSYASHYTDAGLFGVYVGCQPAKLGEVLSLCRDELARAATDGGTAAEVERGKAQVRGNVGLGLEDTGSRMTRLGKSELVVGELRSVDEILDRVAAITPDDVNEVARMVAAAPQALAVVGPFDPQREF
jgi:predicted Zn-dependent peptidase